MKTDFTLLVNMLLPKDVDQPTFNVNVCDPHFVATFATSFDSNDDAAALLSATGQFLLVV